MHPNKHILIIAMANLSATSSHLNLSGAFWQSARIMDSLLCCNPFRCNFGETDVILEKLTWHICFVCGDLDRYFSYCLKHGCMVCAC